MCVVWKHCVRYTIQSVRPSALYIIALYIIYYVDVLKRNICVQMNIDCLNVMGISNRTNTILHFRAGIQ